MIWTLQTKGKANFGLIRGGQQTGSVRPRADRDLHVGTHPGSEAGLFDGYTLTGYDEMFAGPGGPGRTTRRSTSGSSARRPTSWSAATGPPT